MTDNDPHGNELSNSLTQISLHLRKTFKNYYRDFPGGAVVKNPPANAGDTGSIPGPGRPPHAVEQQSPCATTTEPVL